MKVISVDVAPGKATTIFNGKKYCSIAACDLPEKCQQVTEEFKESVLLCWDAPLTGPPNPSQKATDKSAYTKRIIEKFFSRDTTRYNTPKGISVQSYCGCSHWAITRASIGLPRVGQFDFNHQKLPFVLVHDAAQTEKPGHYVVEIHPAVAIWLWCKEDHKSSWQYKDKKQSVLIDQLWKILCGKWSATQMTAKLNVAKLPKPKDDDELDAIVGWVLGVLLINNDPNVAILGDKFTGSFVLPVDKNLCGAFKTFSDAEKERLGL